MFEISHKKLKIIIIMTPGCEGNRLGMGTMGRQGGQFRGCQRGLGKVGGAWEEWNRHRLCPQTECGMRENLD